MVASAMSVTANSSKHRTRASCAMSRAARVSGSIVAGAARAQQASVNFRHESVEMHAALALDGDSRRRRCPSASSCRGRRAREDRGRAAPRARRWAAGRATARRRRRGAGCGAGAAAPAPRAARAPRAGPGRARARRWRPEPHSGRAGDAASSGRPPIGGHSRRIRPLAAASAPARSSQQSRRSGSTGPGIVDLAARHAGEAEAGVIIEIADEQHEPMAGLARRIERFLHQRLAEPLRAEGRLDGQRPEQQSGGRRRSESRSCDWRRPAACRHGRRRRARDRPATPSRRR